MTTRTSGGSSTPPGPSRTRSSPFNFPTPTADRDRTVSRRSKPSSRTTLNGEQPYPWDRLQPQDVMSRHRGAKHRRRYELWAVSACYPRSTFYPLSDGPSIQNHRITATCFRTCSNCHSQPSGAYAIALTTRCPTVFSPPSCSRYSWEETAPVKLPTRHCP